MYLPMRKKRDVLSTNSRCETFIPPLPPIQVQGSFPQFSQTQKDSQFTMSLKLGNSSQSQIIRGRLDSSKNLSQARYSQQSSGGPSPPISQTLDSQKNSYSSQQSPTSYVSQKKTSQPIFNSQLTQTSNISTPSSMARELDAPSSRGSIFERFCSKVMGVNKSQNCSPANTTVFKREPSFSNFDSSSNTQNELKGRKDYNLDKAEAEFVRTESHPMLTELNKNVQLLMDIVKIHVQNCNEPKEKLNENVCEILKISKMISENKSGEIKTKENFDNLNEKIAELAGSLRHNVKSKDLVNLETNVSKLLTLIDTVIKNQKLNHFNYIASRSENNNYKIKQMDFFKTAQEESDAKMEKRMNYLENELANISSMIKTLTKDEKSFSLQQQNLESRNIDQKEKVEKNPNGVSYIGVQLKPQEVPRRKMMIKICPPKDLTQRRRATRQFPQNAEIPQKKKKIFLDYPSDTDDAQHLPSQKYDVPQDNYDDYFR